MATKRIATTEKTHLDQDETKRDPVSNISPAVPSYTNPYQTENNLLTDIYRSVIAKLLAFTVAMIVLPIGSYFASVNTIFGGSFAFSPLSLVPNTHDSHECNRQRNIRRRPSSNHGQRRANRLRSRSLQRRQSGARSRRGREEEAAVVCVAPSLRAVVLQSRGHPCYGETKCAYHRRKSGMIQKRVQCFHELAECV